MGDRGQVAIRQGKRTRDGQTYEVPAVYLYTHWSGSELAATVQAALATPEGRGRWTDECYLARILLDRMTGLEGGETGYGICTEPHGDIEHAILVIDSDKRAVGVMPKFSWEERQAKAKPGEFAANPFLDTIDFEALVTLWIPFDEYVAIPDLGDPDEVIETYGKARAR